MSICVAQGEVDIVAAGFDRVIGSFFSLGPIAVLVLGALLLLALANYLHFKSSSLAVLISVLVSFRSSPTF